MCNGQPELPHELEALLAANLAPCDEQSNRGLEAEILRRELAELQARTGDQERASQIPVARATRLVLSQWQERVPGW